MTREEIIRKVLDTVLWTRIASDDNKNILTDALIKALEQESILDKIEKEINSPNRGTCDYFIVDRIEEIINKYKAESKEVTEV